MQLVTVRNSCCGEVMCSQACVKNSVHGGGGVHPLDISPWVDTPPDTPQADTPLADTLLHRRPLQRTVIILLEYTFLCNCHWVTKKIQVRCNWTPLLQKVHRYIAIIHDLHIPTGRDVFIRAHTSTVCLFSSHFVNLTFQSWILRWTFLHNKVRGFKNINWGSFLLKIQTRLEYSTCTNSVEYTIKHPFTRIFPY